MKLLRALRAWARRWPGAKADPTVSSSADASVTAGSGGGGFGLAGMAERVAALGGQLTTGPTPEGGFEVRAVLPLVRRDDQ
ncbi:MAG: hypothetical protein LBG11_01135 [Bifidobacteriaceae bacterium]|jgi:signal transduction histidine kinase|nr:hypothetical protein [Bifidobacteriaceae bacterium]